MSVHEHCGKEDGNRNPLNGSLPSVNKATTRKPRTLNHMSPRDTKVNKQSVTNKSKVSVATPDPKDNNKGASTNSIVKYLTPRSRKRGFDSIGGTSELSTPCKLLKSGEDDCEVVNMGDQEQMGAIEKTLLQRMDEISAQILESRNENSQQIENLKQCIDKRFDDQDVRLSNVETQIAVIQSNETRNKAEFTQRLTALEQNKVRDDKEVVNDHFSNWLSKVSDQVEARERAERKLNVIISGLESQSDKHQEVVENFIFKYFKMSQVVQEVSVIGQGSGRKYRVKLKDWDSKKIILVQKSRCLRELTVYIDQDYTALEREIFWRVRQRANVEKAKGKKVVIKKIKLRQNSN